MKVGISAAVLAALSVVAAHAPAPAKPATAEPNTLTHASATAPAPAPPSAGPLPTDAFFATPEVANPSLSPSGRYLALVAKSGKGKAVYVLDEKTGNQSVVASSGDASIDFNSIKWKSDDRLAIRIRSPQIYVFADGGDYGFSFGYSSYLQLVDRDGSKRVYAFQDAKGAAASAKQSVTLLSKLPADPQHILVEAPDKQGRLCVWTVDINTGAAALVEAGDDHTIDWWVDSHGQIVERTGTRGKNLSFQARVDGGWREVLRVRPKDVKQELADFEILGAADKPGQLYVAYRPQSAKEGDTRDLRIYDFATRSLSQPVWPTLKYDIGKVVYDQDTGQLSGVCYTVDVLVCDYKDAALEARFRALSRHFGDGVNLQPVSQSDDGAKWVLAASGPTTPGAFYLYDSKTRQLNELGETYPGLPPEKLGRMERLDVKTRDGQVIPAYLTRPPGKTSGSLPLIVMPHGGPEVRDSLSYDPLVQFLATRGYLVLQPNFRGSGGYGHAYGAQGYRQWGRRMQDDVVDSLKQVVASGAADPKRVCIFGASYGGYAALQAGATEPDLFRCVISMAGPSDLQAMLKWEKGLEGADGPAYQYWRRSIGDPDTDKAALVEASPINHAATWRLPILLVHGTADEVVPISQSKAMEKALKKAGKPVRLLSLKGEGHGEFSDDTSKLLFKELDAFLTANLGPATGAAAPQAKR